MTFPLPQGHAPLADTWLVTGVAGFIGSHLAETLLRADRHVVGLDNFSTGTRANLADVAARVRPEQWARFRLVEGDVRSARDCRTALAGVDVALHQAALNSVPRSLAQPTEVLEVNTIGTTTVLRAAAEAGARVVYASSSSVYGDVRTALRREPVLGNPLSPYAVSKRSGELLATVYHQTAGLPVTGLRYFNVYGPRQNPDGPYSAVIPRWIRALLAGEPPVIYGDGMQSRDFTHVDNVVHANLLAATGGADRADVFNVGTGQGTSVRELFETVRKALAEHADVGHIEAVPAPRREGDVESALADLTMVAGWLGYRPHVELAEGLAQTVEWFAGAREDCRA